MRKKKTDRDDYFIQDANEIRFKRTMPDGTERHVSLDELHAEARKNPPPHETRKKLRDATLAVGRKKARR